MKKKILALCLVVVLVATAITGVTLAYFSDESEVVTNTFTVGDIEIKLDEAPVIKGEDDEYTANEDAARVEKNEYEDIYPGQVLPKDPMVTVLKGSEECYVRMFVTANVTNLKAAFPEFIDGDVFDLENLVDWDKEIWPCVDIVNNGDGTATYEFRYFETVKENNDGDTELEPLFTEVTIPTFATNDDLKKLVEGCEGGKFSFDIIAQAIQVDTFASEDAAWAAFGA